jgi:hypothetical protein
MRRYDVPTAITFLFAGLGLGAVLAILFAPRPKQERIEDERAFAAELRALEHDEQAFTSRAV